MKGRGQTMTPIEILATIFAIMVLVKLLFVALNPKLWMKGVESIVSNYAFTTIVYVLLAIIVGYFIFQGLNIVQVAAVMLFTSILMGLTLAPYSKEFLTMGKELTGTRSGVFRRAWLAVVIWAVIAVWTLYAVFA
jgi:magnesium-transporting ATPase (P-type)